MKKIHLLFLLFTCCTLAASAQNELAVVSKSKTNVVSQSKTKLPPSKVDYDGFEALTKEVKEHRQKRLVSLDTFMVYSKQKNTIIIDVRSTEMYNRKHVKGAVHLAFTEFTQANLNRLIPSADTRILLYCNNNFDNDQVNFATKAYVPKLKLPGADKPITLALNIPAYINLYGYGYKNVYELADFVSVYNRTIKFEGTDVIN